MWQKHHCHRHHHHHHNNNNNNNNEKKSLISLKELNSIYLQQRAAFFGCHQNEEVTHYTLCPSTNLRRGQVRPKAGLGANCVASLVGQFQEVFGHKTTKPGREKPSKRSQWM